MSILISFILADESNIIHDNPNTNIDQNEMTYDHSHNNTTTMLWLNNNQQHALSPSFPNERTVSSSSSEQLIPREKQTGTKKLYFLSIILLFF